MRKEALSDRLSRHSVQDAHSECRLWNGSKNQKGYGLIRVDGRHMAAHRAAYQAAIGRIPEGMLVCHKCDTPSCINPDHLFLGTPADNMADMAAKGRARRICPPPHRRAKGERNGHSKLSAAQILAIRSDTRSEVRIGADYGINRSAVGKIRRREAWGHVQ